jgi:monoamine oxidase
MAHTPLTRWLIDACSIAGASATRQVPVEQVLHERSERQLSRRAFVRRTAGLGVAAAGTLAAGLWRPVANAATAPQIVVVGAGLAGLTCAYRLQQAGYRPELYEASERLGGRCWTIRGVFDEGQIAEHGGELIDQGHTQIRQLAQQLGLTLDNLLQAEKNGTEPFYYFDGVPYSFAQATDDLKGIWQKIHSDVSAASYPTLYTSFTQRGYELDHMSVVDWINESVPGGITSKLGQLLEIAYNIEYGAESSEQSSLNLLYLLGYSGQGQLRIFGPSNEKYHVRGGNDQIPNRMADQLLDAQIKMGHELTAIRRNSNGSYTLSFRNGASAKDVTADHVVLALPFAVLRATVNYNKAGFSDLKRTAIAQMGMGTNSKLHVQFKDRYWQAQGCNGDTFADTGYQSTWDVTRAQAGGSGILVDYTGGKIGASFGTGTPASRAQQFLEQIEPVLPGISARWNGKATVDYWTGYQWSRGSYSYWKVGQYTQFAGIERERQGNCHFAGEHTSIDFQGYLNGAVESGERAADEILSDLKVALRVPLREVPIPV